MSSETLIFVYGTLKRGGSNHHHLAGQTFLCEGRTGPGFRLFDLGAYPGMVAHADGRSVPGEVWAVDPECLARLDVLEGVAEGLYRRDRVTLFPPFADRPVETYFYARTVEGRREIVV